MMLHINYSHDGGRTFQWFLIGENKDDDAIIQGDNLVYVAAMNKGNFADYLDGNGAVFDLGRDMDESISPAILLDRILRNTENVFAVGKFYSTQCHHPVRRAGRARRKL
ncbi:hypothetical protein [Burkholderia vietnamiensis]|uniref:hypothetical protein n=1 Tax=Burkholderia vietnamiensis TaxID=60552 RepID=UPI00158E5C70|nr:hypothetical protein [Burkholderia vietnamiensis]MBH9642525.1 hypothetical protein [Burkholderia vietnamiensis]MBR8006880.1 hypothetical protein [Burkholderia vietnamiensis]MDN8039488.1 hypothetical protein [Burkholderia vietnamiensis]HDR9132528.1 hypothetical protein [Burkholderia vietnamiensis]